MQSPKINECREVLLLKNDDQIYSTIGDYNGAQAQSNLSQKSENIVGYLVAEMDSEIGNINEVYENVLKMHAIDEDTYRNFEIEGYLQETSTKTITNSVEQKDKFDNASDNISETSATHTSVEFGANFPSVEIKHEIFRSLSKNMCNDFDTSMSNDRQNVIPQKPIALFVALDEDKDDQSSEFEEITTIFDARQVCSSNKMQFEDVELEDETDIKEVGNNILDANKQKLREYNEEGNIKKTGINKVNSYVDRNSKEKPSFIVRKVITKPVPYKYVSRRKDQDTSKHEFSSYSGGGNSKLSLRPDIDRIPKKSVFERLYERKSSNRNSSLNNPQRAAPIHSISPKDSKSLSTSRLNNREKMSLGDEIPTGQPRRSRGFFNRLWIPSSKKVELADKNEQSATFSELSVLETQLKQETCETKNELLPDTIGDSGIQKFIEVNEPILNTNKDKFEMISDKASFENAMVNMEIEHNTSYSEELLPTHTLAKGSLTNVIPLAIFVNSLNMFTISSEISVKEAETRYSQLLDNDSKTEGEATCVFLNKKTTSENVSNQPHNIVKIINAQNKDTNMDDDNLIKNEDLNHPDFETQEICKIEESPANESSENPDSFLSENISHASEKNEMDATLPDSELKATKADMKWKIPSFHSEINVSTRNRNSPSPNADLCMPDEKSSNLSLNEVELNDDFPTKHLAILEQQRQSPTYNSQDNKNLDDAFVTSYAVELTMKSDVCMLNPNICPINPEECILFEQAPFSAPLFQPYNSEMTEGKVLSSERYRSVQNDTQSMDWTRLGTTYNMPTLSSQNSFSPNILPLEDMEINSCPLPHESTNKILRKSSQRDLIMGNTTMFTTKRSYTSCAMDEDDDVHIIEIIDEVLLKPVIPEFRYLVKRASMVEESLVFDNDESSTSSEKVAQESHRSPDNDMKRSSSAPQTEIPECNTSKRPDPLKHNAWLKATLHRIKESNQQTEKIFSELVDTSVLTKEQLKLVRKYYKRLILSIKSLLSNSAITLPPEMRQDLISLLTKSVDVFVDIIEKKVMCHFSIVAREKAGIMRVKADFLRYLLELSPDNNEYKQRCQLAYKDATLFHVEQNLQKSVDWVYLQMNYAAFLHMSGALSAAQYISRKLANSTVARQCGKAVQERLQLNLSLYKML